jgi:phosphate transport system substrate-binding protein
MRALLLAALLALGGCAGGGALDGLMKVDGSSTVFPLTALAAEAFMAREPSVRIAVGVSGTGGGFAKFGRGEIDVGNASRPIKDKEAKKIDEAGYGFIELPVAYDGLVVAVSPEADWVDCLTVEELKRIWEPGSKVNNWRDVRPGFPDRPLRLYGADTDSGTYDYFTAAVVGEEGKSRADYTASSDDNLLVRGVAGDAGALAFFGLAYLDANRDKVRAVSIDQGEGAGCVAPTFESVENGSYQPLARPEFIYVRADRARDPAIAGFVRFYLQNAAALAPRVGAVPLSPEAYRLALRRFEQGVRGTVFHGSTVGVKLADLLRAEGDSAAAAPPDSSAR